VGSVVAYFFAAQTTGFATVPSDDSSFPIDRYGYRSARFPVLGHALPDPVDDGLEACIHEVCEVDLAGRD
jgi:hypothetical protein